MPEIGQQLSHYSITGKIGKGGMGEVFRAKDQKLGRDVAIKVLPEEFARDADRVARFQREAKLLASLNHPNIAAIYGLEEAAGTSFLVLELVEGETLADRIKAGPIPVEESLKLALQIAEALEAAHEKGVIHRDLKPANIKVTPDGKVKVLDFGLAKAFAADREEVNLSNSPTLSDAATMQGVILGTAAYMAPEQARGKPVDKRADIWAFGCVLYEMLTGQQTWSGGTVTDIIAAALAKDPDFAKLPSGLHPRIRELIRRCLQKDPADRSRDIVDVRIEIKQILADPDGVFARPVAAAESRAKLRTILPWIAAVVILSAITGVIVWMLRAPAPPQIVRFEYQLPEGQQFSSVNAPAFAVSPDGRQFVYGETRGLYLRSVNELASKLIPGTEGGTFWPFFSPDGKWVAYFTGQQLRKISINGGASVTVCDTATFFGANWYADDTIVYGAIGGAMRVSAAGGKPEFLINRSGIPFVGPQILPDGESLLFTDISTPPFKVVVQSLKSGERKELFAGDTGRYLPTGHILYMADNNLLAVPFNPDRLEVTGGAIPVIEGVVRLTAPLYAISESGTMMYVPGATSAPATGRSLVWVDRTGKEEEIPAPRNDYMFPKLSPDGTRVALTLSANNHYDIYIWDFVRKTMTRLTFSKEGAGAAGAIWSPDGKRIVFIAEQQGNMDLYGKAADGTGKDEKLLSVPGRSIIPYSWSTDGKTLATSEVEGHPMRSGKWDIGIVSLEGKPTRKPLFQEEYVETQPQISPDGRWLAYYTNESGPQALGHVYVRPFPEVDKGKWQVSTNGGSCPRWSPDGKELFYLSRENSM
ncbi:MAG: serine/threonine protein kinase, partial [Acidobacteria bacterium]|nr:serine/threonine protein kinase [Acidobacteriota bacterium]